MEIRGIVIFGCIAIAVVLIFVYKIHRYLKNRKGGTPGTVTSTGWLSSYTEKTKRSYGLTIVLFILLAVGVTQLGKPGWYGDFRTNIYAWMVWSFIWFALSLAIHKTAHQTGLRKNMGTLCLCLAALFCFILIRFLIFNSLSDEDRLANAKEREERKKSKSRVEQFADALQYTERATNVPVKNTKNPSAEVSASDLLWSKIFYEDFTAEKGEDVITRYRADANALVAKADPEKTQIVQDSATIAPKGKHTFRTDEMFKGMKVPYSNKPLEYCDQWVTNSTGALLYKPIYSIRNTGNTDQEVVVALMAQTLSSYGSDYWPSVFNTVSRHPLSQEDFIESLEVLYQTEIVGWSKLDMKRGQSVEVHVEELIRDQQLIPENAIFRFAIHTGGPKIEHGSHQFTWTNISDSPVQVLYLAGRRRIN